MPPLGVKLITFGCLCSSTLFAGGNLGDYLHYDVGPVHLRPHLGVAEKFDDNIFYDGMINGSPLPPVEQKSDFSTILSPGLVFSIGTEDLNSLLFDYTSMNSLYWQYPQLNAFEHYFLFQAKLSPDRFKISGRTTYQMLSGVLGGEVNAPDPVSRNVADSGYRVGYELTAKTVIYTELSHFRYDFENNSTYIDYDTLRGSIGYEFSIFPKTALFGEIYLGETLPASNIPDRSGGPNSTFYGGAAGMRGELATRLSYLLKVGYENRTYSSGIVGSGNIVIDGSMTHAFTEKTTLSLGYSRRSTVSIQDPGVIYLTDALTARFLQGLGSSGKVNASFGVSYLVNTFDGAPYNKRSDDSIKITFDILYKIQNWLTGKVGYEFEHFQSSFTGIRNYEVNRFTVQVIAGFL